MKKFNLSIIFKAAHALAKATVKAGDSYSATFAICLKVIYAESKEESKEESIDVVVGGWYNITRAHLFGADIHHANKRNTMQLVSLSNNKAVFLSLHAHNDTRFEVSFNELNELLASSDVKRSSEFNEARYIKAGISRV